VTDAPTPPDRSSNPSVGPVLLRATEIARRIEELGAQITADYLGRELLLVGVLKGAFVVMADLSRAIDLPVEIDFMAVSSYGSSTTTSGVVRIVKDLDLDLAGRHVLLVEDIVDSGLTLRYVRKYLSARNPASLEVAALLVRNDCDPTDRAEIAYVGFDIGNDWVIGYGLDAGQKHRNLPDLRVWVGGSH
jgi:hypoxanthine phosphoribosyltransferase